MWQLYWSVGDVAAIFKMATMNQFTMSHISANYIDRKLFIVSMSKFSESRNPNVAVISVCGGCGSHFQNGRHEFSMSHISANNIDRKLIFVSLALMSGPQNPNMVIILVCGSVEPFSKWQMRNCQCPISWRIMETET